MFDAAHAARLLRAAASLLRLDAAELDRDAGRPPRPADWAEWPGGPLWASARLHEDHADALERLAREIGGEVAHA